MEPRPQILSKLSLHVKSRAKKMSDDEINSSNASSPSASPKEGQDGGKKASSKDSKALKHRRGRKRTRSPSSSSSSSSSSPSASDSSSHSPPVKRSKHKSKRKRRRKGKKKRRRTSTSLDKEEHSPSRQRFQVIPEQDQYRWDLPDNMSDYVNKNFNVFIPEKDLVEAVAENPVPSNLQAAKKLDEYLVEVLKEKNMNSPLAQDNIFEKIQKKCLTPMGPLSRLWFTLEEARNKEGETVDLALDDLVQLIEQSILLMGNPSTLYRIIDG